MKTFVLAILLFGNSLALLAQTASVTANRANDSTKTKSINPVPVKIDDIKKAILVTNNITDNIARAKSCSKFFNLLQAAGLTETFKSKGPITIFVPDDQAFEKLTPGKMDSLLRPDQKPELIALITYHALAGNLTSRDIAKQISINKSLATFTTLAGSKIKAKIDPDRNIILIDENGHQSIVKNFDMEQTNGMLFIINSVLIPKNKLL